MADVVRRYLTVDGITLAYEDYGQGEPILFVHGFPASSYSWRQVAQGLADHNRCICFDMMGYGYSDKPSGEHYSIQRQAELVGRAIREMGLESLIMVGHSLGGAVSLALMNEWGGTGPTAGLVLVDSVCYPQRLPWFIHALRVPLVPRLLMKLVPERLGFLVLSPWMYHPANGMRPDAAREYAQRLHSPGAHEAVVATAKHIVPDNIDAFNASYARISVPTLILWGRQDRVIPLRLGRRLAGDIRDSILCEIDTCGHCPQEEKPEETLEQMRRFVGAVRGLPSSRTRQAGYTDGGDAP